MTIIATFGLVCILYLVYYFAAIVVETVVHRWHGAMPRSFELLAFKELCLAKHPWYVRWLFHFYVFACRTTSEWNMLYK